MLYLLKRLKALMQSGTREITKVAQTFSEIGVCVHLWWAGGGLVGGWVDRWVCMCMHVRMSALVNVPLAKREYKWR